MGAERAVYTFVTLLAMINPIEAAAAFDALTGQDTAERRRAIALRSTIVATIILLGFGVAGDALFAALGITLPAFKIAGGLLLLRVGFNMVFAQQTDTQAVAGEGEKPHPRPDPSVFPLAIPIITGPGALTAIVTLFGRPHGDWASAAVVIVMAIVVMAITYATMRGSETITAWLGETGVDAIGRLAGIVVAAIAVQLIVNGAAAITHGIITAAPPVTP